MRRHLGALIVAVFVTSGTVSQVFSVDRKGGIGSPIRIGLIAPLSGMGAGRGESARQGVALARALGFDDVQGTPLELVWEDVALDQLGRAPAALTRLIEVEQVKAVIGPIGSSLAMAVNALADRYNFPLIVPSGSAAGITQGRQFVIRVWPNTATYVELIAAKLKSTGWRKIAVITSDYENTAELLQQLKARLPLIPVEMVINESATLNTQDFRTSLLKVRDSKADALFLNLFQGQIGVAARQARSLGLSLPFFVSPMMSEGELVQDARALESAWFPRFTACDENGLKLFELHTGKRPEFPDTAVGMYDAFVALVETIRRSGTSAVAIRDFLKSGHLFSGLSGKFFIDRNGDAQLPVDIFTVRNGRVDVE